MRVLTTKSEHAELKEAAADAQTSVSNWLRTVGLERARALAAEKRQRVIVRSSARLGRPSSKAGPLLEMVPPPPEPTRVDLGPASGD